MLDMQKLNTKTAEPYFLREGKSGSAFRVAQNTNFKHNLKDFKNTIYNHARAFEWFHSTVAWPWGFFVYFLQRNRGDWFLGIHSS